jgi:hypothetical protein
VKRRKEKANDLAFVLRRFSKRDPMKSGRHWEKRAPPIPQKSSKKLSDFSESFFLWLTWLPKGHKSLTNISAIEYNMEIPDEFFELNPDIERKKYEEELFRRIKEM